MRKTTGRYTFWGILIVLALFLLNAGSANASDFGLFRKGFLPEDSYTLVWTADDRTGDIVNDPKEGIATYNEKGLWISNARKNHSWMYGFEIPKKNIARTLTETALEVRDITGFAQPGIIVGNKAVFYSFRIDGRKSMGSFSVAHSNNNAILITKFDIPKVTYPCFIGLRHNAKTKELEAFVNNVPVKKITLPYYGMPDIASVNKICIETLNPFRHTSAGGVLYGNLYLATQ